MYVQYRAMMDCTFKMACILPQPRLSLLRAFPPPPTQPNPTQPLFAFRLDCILQLSRDNTHRGTGTGQGPHTDYTRTQHTTTSDSYREQGLFPPLENLSSIYTAATLYICNAELYFLYHFQKVFAHWGTTGEQRNPSPLY